MNWYRYDARRARVTLMLHVQPGAKKTEVAGAHGDALKIKVAAPPVEGAANAALLKFLARRLGVALRDVSIKSGASVRAKVVEIAVYLDEDVLLSLIDRSSQSNT
jgi:uncharacterized protein